MSWWEVYTFCYSAIIWVHPHRPSMKQWGSDINVEAFLDEPCCDEHSFSPFLSGFLGLFCILNIVLVLCCPGPDSLHGTVYSYIRVLIPMLCWHSLFKVHFKYSFYQFCYQWELLHPVCSTRCLLLFTCYFWICVCVCVIWVS